METWSSYIDGLGREGCAADPAALLRPGLELELIRQPADMGRPFSVAVHRRGVLIGYLPKPDARPVAKLLDRGGRARAFVLALRHERSLTGSRLKSIGIEIEAANADGLGWSDSDRAEIAALGIDAPLAPKRRSVATQGRIAGVLCAAVVAVAAWANMPDLGEEFGQGGDPTAAVATATADLADDDAAKTQERPASARAVVAMAEAVPLMPHAALALPSQFTPFDGAEVAPVIVPVRAAQGMVAPSAAPPSGPVAALGAPADGAEADVPLPKPRPDVRPSRRR